MGSGWFTWDLGVDAARENVSPRVRSGIPATARKGSRNVRGLYQYGTDTISMSRSLKKGTPGYSRTLLHELGHATGHRKRLDRPGIQKPNWEKSRRDYAREEIVAELIGYRVAKRLGVPRDPNRSSRRYVHREAAFYGDGGRRGARTPAEAKSVMDDVRAGERMLLQGTPRALARARPQIGAGS